MRTILKALALCLLLLLLVAMASHVAIADWGVAPKNAAPPKYGATPEGRPLTKHYGTETGPQRNIPGSVVDNTINTTKGVCKGRSKTVALGGAKP